MTYKWYEDRKLLTVSGSGKIVGNYDSRNNLEQYKDKAEIIRIIDSESGAFAYCTSFKQIVIPNNVTTILNGCFGECSALTNVTFPKNLEMIAYQGFLNCRNLTSVTLPNKLKKISELSFCGTEIKKANIPSSVTFIRANAFPSDAVLSGVSKLTKMDNNSYLTIEKLPIRVTYDYKAAFEVMIASKDIL